MLKLEVGKKYMSQYSGFNKSTCIVTIEKYYEKSNRFRASDGELYSAEGHICGSLDSGYKTKLYDLESDVAKKYRTDQKRRKLQRVIELTSDYKLEKLYEMTHDFIKESFEELLRSKKDKG